MSKTNGMSANERYMAQAATGSEETIVAVTCPSGFVIEMAKPSKFRILFEFNQLPQAAASGAVESWIEQGVIKPGDIADDQAKQVNMGLVIRDRMLDLSRNPKLVARDPQNDNELDARILTEADTEYLFAWTAAGGETAAMLGNFPQGPRAGAVAGNGGPKRRKNAKRDGRDTVSGRRP